MKYKLQITPSELLSAYLEQVPKGLQNAFNLLQEAELLLIISVFTPLFHQFLAVKSKV